MPAHIEISKSKSKKKPFKVVLIGENGEPLNVAQLFTTNLNCRKNILATMKAFGGSSIKVFDFSSKCPEYYILHKDNFSEPFTRQHA